MDAKEGLMSNSEFGRKNAKWEPDITKVILDICIGEICKSGKKGTHFKNGKWEEIHEEFERRTGKGYTLQQLRTKMSNLRSDWVSWKQLVGNGTGIVWNTQTGIIEADAAWWDAKIRENARYGKIRKHGLEFIDQLAFIFGEAVATSEDAWTLARSVSIETSSRSTTPDVSQRIAESDDDDDDDVFSVEDEDEDEDDSSPLENARPKKKVKVAQDNNNNNKATKGNGEFNTAAATITKSLERLVELAEKQNEAEKVAATSDVHGEYSIPNCIQVLKTLKEEGRLSGRQFGYALELLKDSQNRVMLMSLSDATDALVDWILYKYES